MKPYLYIEELAAATPWSPSAIRSMMARGTFRLNIHYFKLGRRGRPIFKWSAVVELIEGAGSEERAPVRKGIPLASGEVVDIDEAARKIQGLLA